MGSWKMMGRTSWPQIFLTLILFVGFAHQAKRKVDRSLILEIDEIKAFKKVQRTNKNLLVLFAKSEGSVAKKLDLLAEASQEVKGKGTIAFINCGSSKKLCKKLKVSPSPAVLKHFKDGEFNKDYDRQDTLKSLLNFMKDPTGDAPWEEEPLAADVRHVHSSQEFDKLVKKEKKPLLVMFYAPWCGYCKRLKPEYASAASELKGEAVLAGMDVDTEQGYPVRMKFNITGFPTIIYFENGEEKYKYQSGHKKDDLVAWMRNPEPPKEPEKEEEWSDVPSDVVHLTDSSFDEFMEKNPSVLVMFYAPWCGHCKAMKPEYTEAAKTLKEENVEGVLAAVDATKETALGKRFEVGGYPTVKYFKDGQVAFDVNERKGDAIVAFMKDPKEPPPPPPPEKDWSEVESDVQHLTAETFKSFTKKKKHVLVMFYAPWCGHCKKAKPEFMEAAKHYADNTKVAYAAVDCTVHDKLCGQYDVTGYPTLRYFNYGKKDFKYKGGREAKDFIRFMADPKEGPPPPAEPQWSDEPSFVHFLTKNSFDSFVKSQESALIMFYAPWCGHCKAMKPAFVDAAEELIEKTADHALAAVDCTKERELAERFSVSGYPTVKYFRNGEFVSDYNGGRNKEDLVNFILNPEPAQPAKPAQPDEQTEPAKPVDPEPRPPAESQWSDDVIHLTAETFPEFLQAHPSALVMFYAPWCGHCQNLKPAFGELAKHVNTDKKVAGAVAAVDCTAEKTLCQDNEVKSYPTLNYFKDGKFDFKYKGPRTAEKLISFLQNPQKPDTSPPPDWSTEPSEVEFLTDKTFDTFIQDNPSVMVFFYSPRCGFCQKMKPNYVEAAETLLEERPEVILAAVDCYRNKALNKRFITEGYPTVKYFKNGQEEKEYDGDRSTADIIKFINTVDPATESELDETDEQEPEEPEEPESMETNDAVVRLAQNSFDGFVKEKEHVLVMFAAPWCGHCQNAKPKFAEAAEGLKDDHSKAFAAVDCTADGALCDQHNVNGFPTFRYYTFGKFVEEYDGDRSATDFVSFMSDPPKPVPPEKADRKPSDDSRDEL